MYFRQCNGTVRHCNGSVLLGLEYKVQMLTDMKYCSSKCTKCIHHSMHARQDKILSLFFSDTLFLTLSLSLTLSLPALTTYTYTCVLMFLHMRVRVRVRVWLYMCMHFACACVCVHLSFSLSLSLSLSLAASKYASSRGDTRGDTHGGTVSFSLPFAISSRGDTVSFSLHFTAFHGLHRHSRSRTAACSDAARAQEARCICSKFREFRRSRVAFLMSEKLKTGEKTVGGLGDQEGLERGSL